MKRTLFVEMLFKYLLLIIISTITLAVYLTEIIKETHYERVGSELEENLRMLKNLFSFDVDGGRDQVQALCVGLAKGVDTRLTVILPDGTVVGESEHSPELMENHATRPEIHKAFNGLTGWATRYSATLKIDMLYLAVPLREGNTPDGKILAVLRGARPVKGIDGYIKRLNTRIFITGIIVLLITIVLTSWITRSITKPVLLLKQAAEEYSGGNFDVKTRVKRPVELVTLSESMNMMARQLKKDVMTITNHKNKLEAILSHMVEPLILLDMDLVIKEMNLAAKKLFKISDRPPIGYSLIDVVRNVKLYDFCKEAVKSDEFNEITISVKGEKNIDLQVHGTLLYDKEGSRTGFLLVMNDITRLVQLENLRKEFVANVSHELKTPITSIIGFVETLTDGAINDKDNAVRFLTIVGQQAQRLNSIIDDLLSLSMLEQNEDSGIEKGRFKLNEVIANALNVCSLKASRKNIEIQVEGDPELTARVNGFLMEQAVTNLLDNAIKYSEPGSVVRIEYRLEKQEPDLYIINVIDRGSGIPEKDLPHVFERFYRVDKARSRALGGTGLGLAIVKHIMLVHGGKASVKSTPAKGSLFSLAFPVL